MRGNSDEPGYQSMRMIMLVHHGQKYRRAAPPACTADRRWFQSCFSIFGKVAKYLVWVKLSDWMIARSDELSRGYSKGVHEILGVVKRSVKCPRFERRRRQRL